jgi:hypothetical protein
MIKLYLMDKLNEIQSFDLEKDVIYLGRSRGNDIRLTDPYVSSRHLKISKREGKYFVRDLGSKNGTLVQGAPVSSSVDMEVAEGVAITIGISIVCLGRACLESVMPFLDSIFDSEELDEAASLTTLDRPMTLKRNMELISNVSNVLRNLLSLDETLEKILGYIFVLLQRMDRGAIILRDAETGQITDVLSRYKNGSRAEPPNYSRTIVQRVIREGKAFKVLDTSRADRADLSESMEMMRVKSALCVPMISRSLIRGVIYLDSIKEPNGFRNEDLSLLTALGSSAAIAVENALLYERRSGPPLN